MDPILIAAIGTVIFLILMLSHVPIAFSLMIVGFGGLFIVRGAEPALAILGGTAFHWATVPALLPMPLFLLMGQFTFYSGISSDLFDAAYKWLGRIPGGVALATNAACTAFGACCGSPIAATATFGAIAYPEMQKQNYDKGLASALIAAAGFLSAVIPPSGSAILFAFLIEEASISRLFIAGIFPGLVLSVLFLSMIYIRCRVNPRLGPPGQSFPLKEMLFSLKGIFGMVILFVLVIGGLYLGIFTPIEAGACGSFGAFVICLAYRRINLSKTWNAAVDTLVTSCFVLTMVVGANIFNSFLATLGIQSLFAQWLLDLPFSPYISFSLIMVLYIIVGMFMDILPVILITVPIIVPSFMALGFSPTLQYIIITFMTGTGGLTPPVGMGVFLMQQVTGVPAWTTFKAVWYFVLMFIIGAAIVLAFPQIALWLPDMMMG